MDPTIPIDRDSTTYNSLLRDVAVEHIESLDMDELPTPHEIELFIIQASNAAIDAYNLGPQAEGTDENTPFKERFPHRFTGAKAFTPLKRLAPIQLALILHKLHRVYRIAASGLSANPDYDILGMYQTEGDNEGIYVVNEDALRKVARKYDASMSKKDFEEVQIMLRDLADRKTRCLERDLVAVNNGIFDYQSKKLLPFDPDKVFLSKSRVNYKHQPNNPICTYIDPDGNEQEWDVESWMSSLSDDPEVVAVLWQILSAIIRPNVRWNKAAFLYSNYGNNGKGTLCTLMRNLCGEGTYASIPLDDFGKDFLLEPLTQASAIIVDENNVGVFLDRTANFKAVVTNDVIAINRKFRTPLAYQFFGFMVQCLNDFPQIRDRTDSLYRRQLFVPMEKKFTGIEIKEIKDDFLHRHEVLEYVLWRVLHESNFYTFDNPKACQEVLNHYKVINDPVRQFFEELETESSWDLLPTVFVYDLYKAWHAQNIPNGKALGKKKFWEEMRPIVEQSHLFYDTNDTKLLVDGKLDQPEMLILQYDLRSWMNQTYKGPDPRLKASRPDLAGTKVRGLKRYTQRQLIDLGYADPDDLDTAEADDQDVLVIDAPSTEITND